MAANEKKTFIERLAGDKVVWIIVLSLCLISLVSIFSSTSQLANSTTSRLDIVKGQFFTVLGGLLVIFLCCLTKNLRLFHLIAKFGFAISLILLLMLSLKIKTPIVKAVPFNGAWRVLKVAGLQIHVFEVVKVLMVMYMAWAIDTLKKDGFKTVKLITATGRMQFLDTTLAKEVIYIFIPMALIAVLVLKGGTSSALFITAILFMIIILGGIRFRDIVIMGFAGLLVLGSCVGMYQMTKGNEKPLFERLGTAFNRLDKSVDYEQMFLDSKKGSKDYYKALDKIRQPYGAKLAVKEGGILGKGPGQSSLKYVVPVIYEDYIFSFIIEEYGLFGGIFVIILYISLLARGSIIVKNCENYYAKLTVAGLCLMICGQGMFHVVINSDLGILTGQTLPLVSHGTSSFLCFSFAFGVILAISKMTARKIERETKEAPALITHSEAPADDIRGDLDILESFESFDSENEIDI